ncbi:hypothetical protein G6N75_08690 [Thioalkalivibrio sp. XN8]|nr:hypothetical protein [Thioalkalivibrio sp. XN8]
MHSPNKRSVQSASGLDLYHGTSSLFLRSIQEFGLGAKNPVDAWRILEFGRYVLPLAEAYLEARSEYLVQVDAFRTMLSQSRAGMNFQHGNTYASPSKFTAVRYALSNRHGSEILSYALSLFEAMLIKSVPGLPGPVPEQYPKIWQALNARSAPILIRVKSAPISALRSEFDEPPEEQVEWLESLRTSDSEVFPVLAQQCNFRIIQPTDPSMLEISLIVASGHDPTGPEYRLYPLSLEDAS